MKSTRFSIALLALFLPSVCFAQRARYDNFAIKGTNPLQSIAGATITVCTSAGTGIPCTPTTNIYNIASGGLPIGNPFSTDSVGNFGFWADPGTYIVTVTASGTPGYSYTVTLPCQPTSACTTTSNNTHSGTETFTGTINCTIINATRCVSPANPQGWAGADVGAWINSAYANCAAAGLLVCPIQVAPGTYATSATLINFSTLGVFPLLQCAPGGGTAITFSATNGTAVTLNPGRAGLPTDWGIVGCEFIGSGLGNTLTAILSGGTNGAVGAVLRGVQIGNFNIAITFSTNVQGWLLDHSSIADNNQNFVIPAAQSQTGEGISITNSTFGNTTAVWNANCIQIGNAGATLYNIVISHTSIDQCPVNQGNGSDIKTTNLHSENPVNVAMAGIPFWRVTGGSVSHVNPEWISEQTNITAYFVDTVSAGLANIEGVYALNNGGSGMTGVLHVCATCKGSILGSTLIAGSQALPEYAVDAGGLLTRIGGNGSITLNGGASANGATILSNTGQTIAGVTGNLFGWLQDGIAHRGEIDTSGNLGIAGFLSSVNGIKPSVAGAADVGTALLPYGNLFLGTAATNNFKLQPAATTGARTLSLWDWGASGLSIQQQPATVILHTAYTNATTTFSTLGDGTRTVSFPVAANVDYLLTCDLTFNPSATTAVPKIQVTGPAAPTAVNITAMGGSSATTFDDATAAAFSTPITTLTAAATTNQVIRITAGIANGANAGTVALQLAANGAGTLTVNSGSSCRIQ